MNDKNNNYLNYGLALGLVVSLGLGVGALVVATKDDSKSTGLNSVKAVTALMNFFGQNPNGIIQGDGTNNAYAPTLDSKGVVVKEISDDNNYSPVLTDEVGRLPKDAEIEDKTPRFGKFQSLGTIKELLKYAAKSVNEFSKNIGVEQLVEALQFRTGSTTLTVKVKGKTTAASDTVTEKTQLLKFKISNYANLWNNLPSGLTVVAVDSTNAALTPSNTEFFKAYSINTLATTDDSAKAFGFKDSKDLKNYQVFGLDLDRVKDKIGNAAGTNAQAAPADKASALKETNLILVFDKNTGEIKVAYRLLKSDAAKDEKATFVINTVKKVEKDTKKSGNPAYGDFSFAILQ